MSQFFGTRVTVVRQNYQISIVGIHYDDVVTPWPHVGRSDNISGRTEAGPLHDAGGNFCDFRYIILESSTVSMCEIIISFVRNNVLISVHIGQIHINNERRRIFTCWV